MIIDTNGNSFSSFTEDENGYINEIKLNIDAKKSLNYIFYKKDFTKTYDVTDFTYSDATGC